MASATSLQLIDNSSASLEQVINAILGTLNSSIDQIQVRENEKQQTTNATLDVLHQQINHLACTLNSSIDQIQVRENEKQQTTNATLDVLHQQINDLAGTLNSSIDQIQVRENEKQQTTNASLDVLHQQINDLACTLNSSIDQIQVRENEKQQIMNATLDILNQQIDDLFRIYPSSCAAILLINPSSPSDYYSIRSSNGSYVRVYCNMTLSCGNITGGWRKVAELDMTDNNTQCLTSTLAQRMNSNKRTCAINSDTNFDSCAHVNYSTDAFKYSKVCGKIKAYHSGTPDAFHRISAVNIDSNYVDGISLTHGRPRKHIWTFLMN